MSESVIITTPKSCDLHKYGAHGLPKMDVPAAVDGKTVHGQWANMCQSCFDKFGVGLGTGRGQRLVVLA